MNELICNRCNHKWYARVATPKACPSCKSVLWNTKRTRPIPVKKIKENLNERK